MAIEGPLRELALTDVMQLLYLSRKTGTLSVEAEGRERSGRIHFEQGSIVGVGPGGERSRLGRLLVMAGKATLGQVDAALALQRRSPGRRLGALLVETQGVAAADVQRQLRFQVEETVFELVRWRDGHFRFAEAPSPGPGGVGVRVPTESILMEAMRRADEWMELASGEPDASLVPALVDGHSDAGAVLRLEPSAWQVLAAVNGNNTLREIAREIGRAEFEVAKAVYSLASDGVVELRTRPLTAAPSAGPAMSEELARVEGEMQAGRLDRARVRVEELAIRHPGSGVVALMRGRVLTRQGERAEAYEALREAVRHDPLLGEAWLHLGLAAARIGEFGRARDSLDTYARLGDGRTDLSARARRAAALITELSGILEEEI